MTLSKFVILAVLDGWGIAPNGPGNAIKKAQTPNINKFLASYPHTQLIASGKAVGLPKGEPGNTETGHANLGAGRIVYQDLARINMSIAEGSFFENEVLIKAINHSKDNKSDLHLMGLIGAGGVHSSIEHLFALIHLASIHKLENVYLHLFTDGRDSPPTSALTYISKIIEVIRKERVGSIASIMGRYWAMDRDRRWDRTQKAYLALTEGVGQKVKTPKEAIEHSYSQGKTDEFIDPSIITNIKGEALSTIKDNDSIIFFNFRIDRPRQLTQAFVSSGFEFEDKEDEFDPFSIKYTKKHNPQKAKSQPFKRKEKLKNMYFAMMTEYSNNLTVSGANPAFPPETIVDSIGEVIAKSNLSQLRIAESEKSRFVTFYFNGQQNIQFPGEEVIIIPSPKVPTYDQKPEMSAKETTKALLERVKNKRNVSFILINFANPDMIGHTGNIGPTVKAVECVDECIGEIANFVLAYEGSLIITSDHGNAEEMINLRSGAIDTEHTSNPVPFIVVSNQFLGRHQVLQEGILADVAPTVLSLLGLNIPHSMTGRNLLKEMFK